MGFIKATLYGINALLLISAALLFGLANVYHSKQLSASAQALLGLWLFPGSILLYMASVINVDA